MNVRNYIASLEAILFAAGDAVPAAALCAALDVSVKEVHLLAAQLKDRYRAEESGLQLIELEDAYQICTKKECYPALIRFAKQPKRQELTEVVLETLSIIAYKQPVTRAEIEAIRGVSCSHAINKLLEYDLIKELGRLDAPGKPILFGTTEEFLRCFEVRSPEELPQIPEERIEELRMEALRESEKEIDV